MESKVIDSLKLKNDKLNEENQKILEINKILEDKNTKD